MGERGRIVRSNQRLRWHLSEFERPDHAALTTSDAWETDIESQGHDPTHQDLRVERTEPPPAIAERLRLTLGPALGMAAERAATHVIRIVLRSAHGSRDRTRGREDAQGT